MAKKPSPQTPGGKGKGGKGKGAGAGPPSNWSYGGVTHHPGGGPMAPGKGGGHGGSGPPSNWSYGGATHHHHHKPPHHAKHHPKAKHHHHAKKHPKRKLAGAPLDGGWILGGNDVADNCAAVAVANALLAVTGYRTPDAGLLELWNRAGPLSIPEALEESGARFTELQTQPGGTVPWPVVAGLATPHGPHAGLLLGGGLVTWGGVLALPGDWDIEECWAVTWS